MAASSRKGSGMGTPSLKLNTYRWKLPEKWYQVARTLGKSPKKSSEIARTPPNLNPPCRIGETRVSNFFAEWTSQGSFGRNQIQTTQTATLGRFSFFPSGFDPGERYSVDSATPRNTEQHPESHPQQFCLSSLSRIGWCCGAWACRSRERERCLTPDQVSLPAHMFLR